MQAVETLMQGAEVMQNMMNNLESGGQISEDSQGAQGMYNQQHNVRIKDGIMANGLPGYLEDTAKDYAKQATGAYSVPIDTSKFTGQQFVAGEDPLQTSAINLAQQGVGSYSPYLQAAQAGLTTAAGYWSTNRYCSWTAAGDVVQHEQRQED